MSRLTFSVLVNDILDSLGYKMLKVEFNDELIADVSYTKDGSITNNFYVAYRYMKINKLRNKILSEVC